MCIAVFLYHMGILKGGYLGVCVFFVLSGYFSCISAFKKENFSILEYYKNKFIRIYLPLIVTVFISLFAVSLVKEIGWFNLKPESTSVIFGYNNFWQLDANLDYFARHIDSPFMHLWYISIILQFEIVFPFVYSILKKIGDKIHKSLPCIILAILSVLAVVFFVHCGKTSSMMYTYYDTLARSFSLIFGLAVGFVHSYYRPFIPSFMRGRIVSRMVFTIYLVLLIASFFLIEPNSSYFTISMVIVTLIGCRLLDYGVIHPKYRQSNADKFIGYLANISYEIYLIQYPIIFLFQYIDVGTFYLPLVITLTFITSMLIHYIFDFKGAYGKTKWLKVLLCFVIIKVGCFGVKVYVEAIDHTNEMKELENQLAENEEKMQKRQEEYALNIAKEREEWNKILENLEDGEKKLEELVSQIPIVGIGDSVMLGAIDNLNRQFPNGYFDAEVSRSIWILNKKLDELEEGEMLGEAIVINLGANGNSTEKNKRDALERIKDKKVFWLTVTNDADVNINSNLEALAQEYENLHIIDWAKISDGHKEYFYADGIHLTEEGKKEYTKAIYEAIYGVYKAEYEEKKNAIINEHEKENKNKSSFFGGDIMLNSFHILKEEFKNSQFLMDKDYDFKSIKDTLQKELDKGTLNYRVIFAFDSQLKITKEEYEELISMCKNHKVYLIAFDKVTATFRFKDVETLDFYRETLSHEEYLMVDKIHLTTSGNKALCKLLKKMMK